MTILQKLKERFSRDSVTLDLHDIQALILRSRPEPYVGIHAMLHFDEAEGARYWREKGMLVRGPALVRSAVARGGALTLTGDTSAASPLEIWAPRAVRSVSWNGAKVTTKATAIGSIAAVQPLAPTAQQGHQSLGIVQRKVTGVVGAQHAHIAVHPRGQHRRAAAHRLHHQVVAGDDEKAGLRDAVDRRLFAQRPVGRKRTLQRVPIHEV